MFHGYRSHIDLLKASPKHSKDFLMDSPNDERPFGRMQKKNLNKPTASPSIDGDIYIYIYSHTHILSTHGVISMTSLLPSKKSPGS